MSRATTIADRIASAFNAGDVDQFAACFREDAVQLHPFFPEPLVGRTAIRNAEAGLFGAFDQITMSVLDIVDGGDKVALELRVTAVNSGPIPMPDGSTIPSTGRSVDLTMAAVLLLDDDGQIVTSHRYQDNLGFLRSLGLVP